MSGSTLLQLLDFVETTGDYNWGGVDEVINEAQVGKYGLSWLLSGDSTNRVQGGKKIRDDIMLDAGNTGVHHLPGYTRNYSNPNALTRLETEWRFFENHVMHLEQESELQDLDGRTATAKVQIFKDLMASKKRRMATDTCNNLDGKFFAQPDVTLQDGGGAAAVDPLPIFAMCNEYGATAGSPFDTDGIHPKGTGLPNGFTTLQSISPTTNPGWRCWQFAYGDDALSTNTVNAGASQFYTAFDLASEVLNVEELPWNPTGNSTTNTIPEDYIIMCSLIGKNYASKMARSSNDQFRLKPQDARYGGVSHAGMPFRYFTRMNTAYVYPTSGTTAPVVGSGAGEWNNLNGTLDPQSEGPRYKIASKTWLRPFFHSKHYFEMRPGIIPPQQPDVMVKVMSLWYNYFYRSRMKFAEIFPSADITGAGVTTNA